MAAATIDATIETDIASTDRLSFTLFLALALHALILFGIGIGLPDKQPPKRSLEITLAQYRSEKAPDEADFLAQANQEGSGDLAEKKQLSTNQVADFSDTLIREVQPIQQVSASQTELKQQQKVLSTNANARFKTFAPKEQELEDSQDPEEEITPIQRNLEIASLEAQLRQQKQILAKSPRKRQLTAASAKEARDALYLDNWRKRIEAVGNRNYPKDAGVYGDLRLMVAINADGTVDRVKILKSSGHKVLDDTALRIVQLAAPYEPFPTNIRKDTDILEIVRTWRFKKGNYLSSE